MAKNGTLFQARYPIWMQSLQQIIETIVIINTMQTWTGTYRYNTKIPAFMGRETGFTITITEHDGIRFKGTVVDDPETGGMKGQGTITGKVEGGKIEFVKQMPVLTMADKEGRKYEIAKKHRPVYYRGIVVSEQHFEGEWKIKGGLTWNRFVIGFGLGTKGTWKIEEVNTVGNGV